MANKRGSEHQSRPPMRLLISVLLVGTLLAWWGTRDHRHLFGEPFRKPTLAEAAGIPQNIESNSAMLARGSQIERENCAGCHELVGRSTGPSYREITSFYRRRSTPSDGTSELLSRLAAAVSHPQPGWTNFVPGPAELGLSLEDRVAVASWILKDSDQMKNASEGTGQ